MQKKFPSKQRDELLAELRARFEKNLGRHQGLVWARVQAQLESRVDGTDQLWFALEPV